MVRDFSNQRSETVHDKVETNEGFGRLILKGANRAVLMRVVGIGKDYADLAEAAGVDTLPEWARRKVQNLFDGPTWSKSRSDGTM